MRTWAAMDWHTVSNRRWFARALTLSAAWAIVVIAASDTSAALWLVLKPAAGPPGTAVVGRTGGQGALSALAPTALPVFLAPSKGSEAIGRSTDPAGLAAVGLVRVGTLRAGADGNGTISFRIPSIDPGTYTVFVRCDPCARYSAGRNVLPVGEFRVTASSGARARSSWAIVAAISLGAILAGTGVVVARRRGARFRR